MTEQELYPALLEKLDKDFSLEKDSLPALDNLQIIREHLVKKVMELMTRDYNRFVNNLYRIDIDENKVLEVLNLRDKTMVHEKLTDLIIERQLQRVKTQHLYKDGKL